jgi:glycine oxidase
MVQHPDILIIGGGVIGLTTAWFLGGEGASVLVVEQGEVGRQASWAGAGIIPPGDPARAHSPADLLRAHSSRLYPRLSADLREATGVCNGYVVCGGVELPDPGEPDRPLPTEEWHSEGIVFELLDRAGLREVVPEIDPGLEHGAHLPDMAQVRNPRHLKALRAGCAGRGVRFVTNDPVRRLLCAPGRVLGVEAEHATYQAGQFLLAAGAWTGGLLAQAGWECGIAPVRGQMVLFRTGREGVRPLLLQGKRYLVPRCDGRVLAGSTEEDAGFDARNTSEGVLGLTGFARRLLASLGTAEVEQTWAGLRPGSPDGLPFLGAVPPFKNLHVAAGHFRAGLQLSPGTGLVMAQHLLGQPTLMPLGAFRLGRPAGPLAQTAFRS